MHSMTGYGRAQQSDAGRELTIEIKTVNHRFMDINLRMPRGLLFLEDGVRKTVSAWLSRGHADVFLTYRNTREDARDVSVDTSLALAYITALDELAGATDAVDDRTLTNIAALPNVLTVTEREDDQDALASLSRSVLESALAAVISMRKNEGDALSRDLTQRLNRLTEIADTIAARAPLVVTDYKARLEARLSELLSAPVEPVRVAQEIALMADRAAIDEELVRLSSHIAQMRGCLLLAEPIGRKLDFLTQELGREVNTIGSKASDLTIATLVIDAKAEIEKLREQVQNIE